MKKNAKNAVALLVFSCDQYEFLYEGFDFFFKKNWGHVPGVKNYFATENIDAKIDGFQNLKSGDGPWTNRLKFVLDQIEEDYIIFFQEDMWLNKPVAVSTVQKIIHFALDHQTKLVKLHSTDAYVTEETTTVFDGLTLAKINTEKSNFLLSHQVSIWDKAYFYAQLEDDENPWKNEVKGSDRMRSTKEAIFQIDLLSFDGKSPNNGNEKNAQHSAYYGVSVKGFLHPEISRFIRELKPQRKNYAKQLSHHHRKGLKHYEQTKPASTNVFSKVKHLFSAERH